jgi:hypothetical protein
VWTSALAQDRQPACSPKGSEAPVLYLRSTSIPACSKGSRAIGSRFVDLTSSPTGFPPTSFDLVHARLLLMHLPSRLAAIRRLTSAARPGGWIAAVDPDFTTVAVSPTNSTWERTWSVFCDTLIAGGWDPRYGARLCDDLRAAGLVEVHADYVASRDPGGSVTPRLLSLTFERLRQRMVTLGADDHDINEARALLEDPANTIYAPTTCFAHARRPDS